LQKEKTISDIRMQTHKKLAEVNIKLKAENEELRQQTMRFEHQF